MSAPWSPVRIAWAIFGAAVLIVAGAGTYLALNRPGTHAGDSSVLKMHAAPRALPDLAFVDGTGNPKRLADFRGKVVLVNIWATWCPPCREEMPSLDRLQKALGGPGFEVVALSIDTGGASAVQGFYREIGIGSLAVYVDSSMRATSQLSAPGVPTTLLVDARGRELGRHSGPAKWDDAGVVREISALLER
jgi:thiol-disulfide isomerase/thioredoxin